MKMNDKNGSKKKCVSLCIGNTFFKFRILNIFFGKLLPPTAYLKIKSSPESKFICKKAIGVDKKALLENMETN